MPDYIKFANKEKCIGCQICELACSSRLGVFNPEMANLHIHWDYKKGKDNYEVSGVSIMAQTCNRCDICLRVCPKRAISEVDGALAIDNLLCDGCRVCVQECPRNVITTPGKYPFFCDMCGGKPKCIDWCPYGVLEVVHR